MLEQAKTRDGEPLCADRDFAAHAVGFWWDRMMQVEAHRRAEREEIVELRILAALWTEKKICFNCMIGLHQVCDPNACICCGSRGQA